jgi:hypothetical protein
VSPIHLHLNHADIFKPAPDHILVEDILDYAPAYACMAEAIHTDQPLTVVVRHPTCAAWLETARQKYGPQGIQVTAVPARRRLAELWGVEVSAWVTDEFRYDVKLLIQLELVNPNQYACQEVVSKCYPLAPAQTQPPWATWEH